MVDSPEAPSGPPPYNPLDKRRLGESVAKALLAKMISGLPPSPPFEGAGVYAIYYAGKFPLYAPIARRNVAGKWNWPIYVGKAVPLGARKGGRLDAEPGLALYKRLCEHAESIASAEGTLRPNDFVCRYMVVDDIWIPLGESLLIEMFNPVWNRALDGFGNHDPGSGRYNQQRSQWDVLHPGRSWAVRLQPNRRSLEEITAAVAEYLAVDR